MQRVIFDKRAIASSCLVETSQDRLSVAVARNRLGALSTVEHGFTARKRNGKDRLDSYTCVPVAAESIRSRVMRQREIWWGVNVTNRKELARLSQSRLGAYAISPKRLMLTP